MIIFDYLRKVLEAQNIAWVRLSQDHNNHKGDKKAKSKVHRAKKGGERKLKDKKDKFTTNSEVNAETQLPTESHYLPRN